MTDDLVKRLRRYYAQNREVWDVCEPAADRIEKLEAALREISRLDYKNAATNFAAYDAHHIARKALEGKDD